MALDMAILLRPQLLINLASFDQHVMRSNIDDLASLNHQDHIAVGQKRRRWDTSTMVRPSAIRCRLALTMASLCGSSALVASSRMRMRGS